VAFLVEGLVEAVEPAAAAELVESAAAAEWAELAELAKPSDILPGPRAAWAAVGAVGPFHVDPINSTDNRSHIPRPPA